MGGRGKRGKATTNTRGGAGRGQPGQSASAPNPANLDRPGAGRGQYAPAPTPAQSAWGRPAPASAAPAPAPAQSAWGAPAPAPIPTQSAWGRPAPVAAPAPTQPAWGMPTQAAAPNPTAGPSSASSSSRAAARSGGSERRERPPPRRYEGYYSSKKSVDRGSTRDRQPVYSDLVVTKIEGTKQGTTGRVVPLLTNYFRIVKRPQWQLYQYRVDFNPPIDHGGFAKRLIRDQKPNLGGYLFDGTMLFLCVKLHNEVTEFTAKDQEDNPILIKVKFVKMVSMLTAEAIQILNLILRRSMSQLNLQLVGRSFFDAVAKINVPNHRLQLWPGYDTSIRQHERDILLCAQVTTKVMRTETVYDILRKIKLSETSQNNYQHEFANAVLGMTVLTEYNNKTYRIDDVCYNQSPMDNFDTRTGPMTYVDYYRTKYGINIRDKNQPMLITKSTQRDLRGGLPEQILLIPEICRATGFTAEMRKNFRLMNDLAQFTRFDPKSRMQKLLAFNNRLQSTPESMNTYSEWGFGLDKDLVKVNGRELPNETVYFGNQQSQVGNDWSRAFHRFSMYSVQPLKNWVVIVPKSHAGVARAFIGILRRAADGMRYPISEPHYIDIDDLGGKYVTSIDDALKRDPQLVMCILLSAASDKYSAIKKKLCLGTAKPSQVMLVNTITPKQNKTVESLLSVGTKVAIQLNTKLGGAPWVLDVPPTVMVVGFDVCHDTNDKKKSYGALVASMEMKKNGKFFSAVTPHKDGQELSNSFALNLSLALKCYKETEGYLPTRIFIYRDGVGEGQTDYVREHEIKAIVKQLNTIYEGTPPRLLFTVVSKRINTRFFKGNENPSAGTVVDDVVTLPERHDFFLVSPSVRNGTVNPTNYNILYNTSGLSSDNIQKFTFKMTHMYYNWTATLSVPAVCQYAHKLAFLVGNYIHQSPSAILEKQLYFL